MWLKRLYSIQETIFIPPLMNLIRQFTLFLMQSEIHTITIFLLLKHKILKQYGFYKTVLQPHPRAWKKTVISSRIYNKKVLARLLVYTRSNIWSVHENLHIGKLFRPYPKRWQVKFLELMIYIKYEHISVGFSKKQKRKKNGVMYNPSREGAKAVQKAIRALFRLARSSIGFKEKKPAQVGSFLMKNQLGKIGKICMHRLGTD